MNTQTPITYQTNDLINALADRLDGSRRYHSALYYFSLWFVGSLAYILLVANVWLDIRFDIAIRITDWNFLATVGFMLIAACCFAYSTIVNALPGQKDRVGWFGIASTCTWIGLVVYGMVCDISGLVNGGVFFNLDTNVLYALILGGSIPLLGLWLIVKHLAPTRTVRMGVSMSLASFMLAATVMRFYYVSLYQGVDCSFNLFFLMLVPLMVSSLIGWASVSPFLKWSPARIAKQTKIWRK